MKQYKEVGRSGTEAGGADQTFHPPAEVKDRQELHCFRHIRNQKEPKSRWIKSHWKSEALLWLSRAEGHTCCRTGMFSAYLCGHARPPVTTENTPTSVCCTVIISKFTLQKAHESEIYREEVHGWLRRVHDEVAEGESEPLGSSTQQHSFRSRPWELLFWRELHRRGAGRAPPFWGFILWKKAAREELKLACFHLHWRGNWVQMQNCTAVNCVVIRGHAWAFHILCQHVASVNSQWPRVKSIVTPLLIVQICNSYWD